MKTVIKIGTRASKLALWQAKWVKDQLDTAGFSSEIVEIITKGDKILDRSLSKIGSKGLFTEELEESLANGDIDIAVHSAKDLSATLTEGFEIIAFSEREKAHDVLLADKAFDLSSEIVIGTSSTRRVALLRKYYPNAKIVDMRGNLQTRIQKMRNADCDVLMLAYAGVHRMGYASMIIKHLDKGEFCPPAGQGVLAIECHATLDNSLKAKIRAIINHDETENAILSERA
jgi:hydroxymethylbilane synthase